jgi:hypothetical protein
MPSDISAPTFSQRLLGVAGTAALAIAGAVLIGGSSRASAADARHPTVVELYQSQGCSSCPPAIRNINRIASRPDILALTFAVTYWDQLGWKDTFAKPEFTERERDYARSGQGQVATPQTIVNGRVATNGGNGAALIETIRQADRGTSGPEIATSAGKVSIGHGTTARPATIWLVRYDARTLDVPIRAGENGGKTIAHRNIVRSLTAIGSWSGAPMQVAVNRSDDPNLRSAIIVQSGKGGPILAAARL